MRRAARIGLSALGLVTGQLLLQAQDVPAKPAAPTAESLLAPAFERAGRENKAVLIDFGAQTWCIPCRKLDALLAAKETKPIFDAHFVVVKITVWESKGNEHLNNPGAALQMNTWGGGRSIPYIVVADPARRVLQTSATGALTRGYPESVSEIEDFVAALLKHAPRMSPDERSQVLKWMLDRSGGLGSIEGRVLDSSGEPMRDATVWLVRLSYSNGLWLPAPTGQKATTNQSGRYVINGIEPGTYRLLADIPPRREDVTGPSFHPNASRFEDAGVVAIDWGQAALDRDIALNPVAALSVAGVVTAHSGRNAGGASVVLTNVDWPVWSHRTATAEDGTFRVERVRPGRYHLWAELSPDSGREATYRTVDLVKSEPGLVVRTNPGTSVSGTLVFGAPPPANRRSVRASAVLVNQPPGAPPANRLASAGADGRFTINDVFGQRLIRAEDLPPDWFVASVLHAGRDITDKPTEFGAKAAGLVVRIQKGATLQGSVSGGSNSGAAIVFPVDPLRRGYYSRFVKTSPIGVDGKFVIRGLPGGSYHVLRVPALTPNWDAPKELDKLVPQARTLVLRAGAVQMIQLPASGGR